MKMGIKDTIKGNKKVVLISAAVILIAALTICGIFVFRSNQTEEPTLDEIVSDKLSAYMTDISDSLETLDSNEKIADYLMNWASNKNIKAAKDDSGNVIFSRKASSDELKKKNPVVIACEYDASNILSYIDPISTALTVAKNAEENGSFKVIFMPKTGGEMLGVSALSESILTDDTEVFFLGKSSSSKVALTTGGYEEYLISDKLKRTSPTHDKAYRISIKGVEAQPVTNKTQSSPNPIKQLGSLLANFKSTSFIFELSSFSGGTEADISPSKASVSIVINSTDDEKFHTKMDKAIDKFYDKYADAFPDAEYTYEEVELPKKVLKKTETENLISLLYTSPSGVYYKDDDGNIVAVTNIGKISLKNGKLSIGVCAMSSSDELTDEIHDSYRTIAGLCNAKIKTVENYDIFRGTGKSEVLLADFENAFREFTYDSEMIVEDAVETTACSVFCEKNPNMAILYCAMTEKTTEKFAGSLITYLNHSEQE